MGCAVELSDVHDIVLVLQDRSLVIVYVEVVRGREDGHHTRKACGPCLAVHSIASILGFVGPDNGEKVVLFEEVAGGRIRKEVGAASNVVMHVELASLFLAEFFKRIGPEDIAHQAMSWRFSEAIDLIRSARGSLCSVARTALMSSRVCNSGLNPPWIHRNCLFMIAANGSEQNDSIQASYILSLYLCLHSSLNVK